MQKEREVQRNIDDGIVPYGGNLTVLQLTKKYILQRNGIIAIGKVKQYDKFSLLRDATEKPRATGD